MDCHRGCLVLLATAMTLASTGVVAHLLVSPPESPCPAVFRYEPAPQAATGWVGVVRLLAPPKFSALHLSLHLAASQHLPGEPGTLSLRGGVAAARALIRSGGRREVVEFVAEFPCATSVVPRLINVTANGQVFCSAQPEPSGVKSTISLEADLETGFDRASTHDDFGVAPADSKVRPFSDALSQTCVPTAQPHEQPPPVPVEAARDTVHTPSPSAINLPSVNRSPAATGLPVHDALAPEPPPPPPPPPPPLTPPRVLQLPPPPDPPAVPAPPNDECGTPWGANALVTRGAAAARGRWPWLVALFKKLGRRDQLGLNFECGATLVSRKHVLTAAHCVEARRGRPVDAATLVAYLGKHDLLSYTEPGQQTAEVAAVRLHPQYGRDAAYANDIALLVLADDVEPTRQIRPVCLGEPRDADSAVGKIGAVPGWGKDDSGAISNEIRVANMPIVSQEACLRSNVFYHSFTSDTTFCAGFRNGTSVCNGDSGGGLFLKGPDGRWHIRGIVSVSMFSVNEQSCDSYNYAVFTDVAKFMPWLYDQMYATRSA